MASARCTSVDSSGRHVVLGRPKDRPQRRKPKPNSNIAARTQAARMDLSALQNLQLEFQIAQTRFAGHQRRRIWLGCGPGELGY